MSQVDVILECVLTIYRWIYIYTQSWSELLAPLVNMIKGGRGKLICIVNPFDLLFKKIVRKMRTLFCVSWATRLCCLR